MRRFDLGGHELRVDEAGAGALCFVCIHGLVDTLEVWDRLVPALAERGRIVRFDQRGHGESTAPPGPCRREELAADVLALLDRLGVTRAVLVGHSLGGVVAMTAALLRPAPIAGLVLIGTTSQCSEKVAGWYERIARAGERAGAEGLARAIYGEHSRRRVVGDARGIAAVARVLANLHADPLTPKLGDLRCPALALVGERDPMGEKPSRIVARSLPDASLEVVRDGGHWVHLDAPELLIRAIDRWGAARDLFSGGAEEGGR